MLTVELASTQNLQSCQGPSKTSNWPHQLPNLGAKPQQTTFTLYGGPATPAEDAGRRGHLRNETANVSTELSAPPTLTARRSLHLHLWLLQDL